jgi:hypothetical protein
MFLLVYAEKVYILRESNQLQLENVFVNTKQNTRILVVLKKFLFYMKLINYKDILQLENVFVNTKQNIRILVQPKRPYLARKYQLYRYLQLENVLVNTKHIIRILVLLRKAFFKHEITNFN